MGRVSVKMKMKLLQVELTCHLAAPAHLHTGLSLPCGASTTLVRQPDLVIILVFIRIIIFIMTIIMMIR